MILNELALLLTCVHVPPLGDHAVVERGLGEHEARVVHRLVQLHVRHVVEATALV